MKLPVLSSLVNQPSDHLSPLKSGNMETAWNRRYNKSQPSEVAEVVVQVIDVLFAQRCIAFFPEKKKKGKKADEVQDPLVW